MEKKFDIENDLEMLLDDQLVKEAELLEKELFADDSFEDYQETPEEREASKEKLVNRLKADGLYREEKIKEIKSKEYTSEETENKISRNKKLKRNKKIKRFVVRAAGIVIVSGLCVFAASMTSEANRNYFLHNMRILTGNDTRVVNSNDESNDLVTTDEYAAIAEIEKELNIDVPEFMYRPEGLQYVSYELDSIVRIARIEYSYEDYILVLHMYENNEKSVTNINSMHGKELETVYGLYEEIMITLGEIRDENDLLSSYYATWEKDGNEYFLMGKIDYEELFNIINNFVF